MPLSNDNGKVRLSDHVYGYVKEQLLDGRYEPEDWIPIEEISQTLGVSRQPVMGALKRLAIEGLVTIVPQVGCRARRYDLADAIDFYRLFAEGEALLAGLAAERAEPSDLIALRVISAQIGQLRDREKSAEELGRMYRTLNNRFHSELHRIARSPAVAETVEIQRDRSDFYVALAKRPIFGERLRAAHDEHEDLFDAISQKDAKRASDIMREHVLAIVHRFGSPPQ